MKSSKGFTLIELMIVMAIIGILAAIAIPAYQRYVVRSQISEGLNLVGTLKPGIAEFFAVNGHLPENLDAIAQTSPSGKYVTGITLEEGAILISFGGESADPLQDTAHNALAITVGVTSDGGFLWQCGTAPQPVSEDAAVAWSADAAEFTTIEGKYLPTSCRG